MKQLTIISILLLSSIISLAQFVMPAEVTQRLGNDKSFTRYAYETMRFVKMKQLEFSNNPVQKTHFEKQEKFLARQLLYLESRQDSLGNIFNYAEKTYDEFNNYSATAGNNFTELANGLWTLVGPTNNLASTNSASRGQGRVDRFAFHPSDPTIVYAGTPAGGLWKSTNSGSSWSSLTTHVPNLSVSGIVVSWADPNDLYILTGDGDSNGGDDYFVQGFDYIRPSIGVLKSTDGGVTWNKTGDFGIPGFYVGYKLIQSPTNASLLIAATSEGLYRTTNGGGTWDLVSPNTDRYFDVEWKPGSSLKVYAATNQNFYISSSAGATFLNQDDNFNYPIQGGTRIAIAVTPANPACVYVFAGYSSDGINYNIGVFKSTDSGDEFIRKTLANFLVASARYMHNIAVSNYNEDLVITGSLDLYKSTSGGTSFSLMAQGGDASLSNFAHADVHDIAFNPIDGTLYIGTDGGVHKSTDNGTTLTTCYNMANTQVYHFNVSESNNDYMLAGAQDNGTMLRNGATSTFYHFTSGDGYAMEFYHGAQAPAYFSVNKNLYKTNILFTGHTQMPGLNESWYKPIAISYFNNDIVYSSSDTLYKTTNGGTSWTNMGGGNARWTLITCPSNSSRIYGAGGASWNDGGSQADKKFFRSDDGGVTRISLRSNPGFPSTITRITDIAVNPNNSSHVWVTMGGFTDNQKVYYSANSGGNWTNLTGSLPNLPVNCVAVDENLDVYVGTDIGVFFRSSTMTDWQPFYNYLPQVPVTELHIRGTTIYASTFGRGIWKSTTHTDCEPSLTLNLNMVGHRFYEALNINSSSTLTGGIGTDVFYKAQNAVTLTENFRANAGTGESFKAWIANCNSGGIPLSITGDSAHLKVENNTLEFVMPFDGKASLIVVDENGIIKNVIADNGIYRKGNNKLNKTNMSSIKGKLILIIDGEVAGRVSL